MIAIVLVMEMKGLLIGESATPDDAASDPGRDRSDAARRRRSSICAPSTSARTSCSSPPSSSSTASLTSRTRRAPSTPSRRASAPPCRRPCVIYIEPDVAREHIAEPATAAPTSLPRHSSERLHGRPRRGRRRRRGAEHRQQHRQVVPHPGLGRRVLARGASPSCGGRSASSAARHCRGTPSGHRAGRRLLRHQHPPSSPPSGGRASPTPSSSEPSRRSSSCRSAHCCSTSGAAQRRRRRCGGADRRGDRPVRGAAEPTGHLAGRCAAIASVFTWCGYLLSPAASGRASRRCTSWRP